jgi:DNA-binding XRE family transcriptional regulator
MEPPTVCLEGREYVIIPLDEYERLMLKAQAADLPALPERGSDGTYPALEYVRIALARDIILARVEAGLTQLQLAELASVRLETLRRVESGQNSSSIATVDKIDRALQQAAKSSWRSRKT